MSDLVEQSIAAEIALDSLMEGLSISSLDSLRAHNRRVQREILDTVKDERQRMLLMSLANVNEGMIVAMQRLLAGWQALNERVPELSLALREKRFHAVLSSFPSSMEELDKVMRPEAVSVEPLITPSRLPIFGNLIDRVKSAFHYLVIFYVRQVALKQAEVNRVYGKYMLFLLRRISEQREEKGGE